MKSALHRAQTQTGAFLLEALIGILIFSLGILGIVGLQAQSMRFTNDAEYRAEAVYLANSVISKMWAANRCTLAANYDSVVGGPEYVIFRDAVLLALPHANTSSFLYVNPPLPIPQAPSKASTVVQVGISWQLPGDPNLHNYTTTGVIGQNEAVPCS